MGPEYDLLRGFAKVRESRFDPNAKSWTGAQPAAARPQTQSLEVYRSPPNGGRRRSTSEGERACPRRSATSAGRRSRVSEESAARFP